jgi:quercetin dioxygenase-like cupin family protein
MGPTDDPTDPAARPTADAATPALPVDLRDWVRFSTSEAVRVRVQRTPQLAVDLWCIEPQQATTVLRADGDVTYTVLAGRSWFVTEDGDVGLDPLGNLLVPRGVAHGIDNRAPDPLIVLAVSSPPDAAPADIAVSDAGTAVRDPDPTRRGIVSRLRRVRPSA